MDNNNSIWASRKVSKAEKIWKLANEIGVKGKDGDDVYIGKINEMESKDKSARGKKATIPTSK